MVLLLVLFPRNTNKSIKRRIFCMSRNTRSKLMHEYAFPLGFNFLHFWYVSQAANKLKKFVWCFIRKFMLKWRDFRWYAMQRENDVWSSCSKFCLYRCINMASTLQYQSMIIVFKLTIFLFYCYFMFLNRQIHLKRLLTV
jgi:hypothetical protein